jgi:hypothetical protein
MLRRATRTEKLDDKFFGAVEAGQTISAAAETAGYSRRAVYDWRKSDETFGARWDEAVAIAVERLEAEADRRAVEGTLEPVYYKGAECGQVRRYSDTLLIFRLKALDPRKYRERASIEHTGKDGDPLIQPETDRTKIALGLLTLLNGLRGEDLSREAATARHAIATDAHSEMIHGTSFAPACRHQAAADRPPPAKT